MNIIDLAVFLVFGFGFLLGWHHGFMKTTYKIASFFVAWLAALVLHGFISSLFLNNGEISSQLLYLTAGAEKLSDMSVANIDVAELSLERINEIISASSLPSSIAGHMQYNISNQVFFARGIVTMSDYFNQTIIILTINLLSFLLVYGIMRVLCNVGIEIANRAKPFPVLKQHDRLYGGLLGIIQGIMICFVVFSIVPILLSVLPLDGVKSMVEKSLLGRLFFNANIITNALSGR